MGTVDVGNEDFSVAIVRDFALRGINDRGKRDANKDRCNDLLHAFGALTLGKRAFLIRRFRFFPWVEIRYIESCFSPATLLRKSMLVLLSQTPSQPYIFFVLRLVAC